MRESFLPFSPPSIGEEEIAEVADALRSDWITTGPRTKRLEQDFCEFVGAPAALAVNSGTAALHLALLTCGIGPDSVVISTPLTFCSSIHVIEHVGARPILVDVERDTLNIDPARILEAVERDGRRAGTRERPWAILPVHLYGHPCDMDAVLDIAATYGMCVVEDAAHALAASYKGRMIGTLGTLTAFSFYATKNLTTAEGGMVTGEPSLIDEARIWSLHGMNRDAWTRYSSEGSWFYDVIRPGFKYNLTDVQAAIGIHQLRRMPRLQQRRRQIFETYNQGFSDLKTVEVPTVRPEVDHARHLYVLRLNLGSLTIDRARFIEELRLRRIGASVHFIPIHLHAYYRERYGFRSHDFPVAYGEYQRIVTLPLYPRMTDEDVLDVIDAVRDIARQFRR